METVSLANHFLIAMPAMADPNFSRTLTYTVSYTHLTLPTILRV